MDNEETYIFGYMEQSSNTALCTFCAQVVYAHSINTALGANQIVAIRAKHAKFFSKTLRCVKCDKAILAPGNVQVTDEEKRLAPFREFVNRTDLGGEL